MSHVVTSIHAPHRDTGDAKQEQSGDVAGERNPPISKDDDPRVEEEPNGVVHDQGLGEAQCAHLMGVSDRADANVEPGACVKMFPAMK